MDSHGTNESSHLSAAQLDSSDDDDMEIKQYSKIERKTLDRFDYKKS